MLTFLEKSSANVIGVKASGKLRHEDYQVLVPRLEQAIQEHGKLRILFELEDCRGWNIRAAWDDLKFGLKHGGDFERCAVVGEKRWQKWMTQLSRPFFRAKYFDKSQIEEAWKWVEQETSSGSTSISRI